jgi:hypothetical protein
VKSVDLSGFDFTEEDVFEGARPLHAIGPRVEGEPHAVKHPTKHRRVVFEKA